MKSLEEGENLNNSRVRSAATSMLFILKFFQLLINSSMWKPVLHCFPLTQVVRLEIFEGELLYRINTTRSSF